MDARIRGMLTVSKTQPVPLEVQTLHSFLMVQEMDTAQVFSATLPLDAGQTDTAWTTCSVCVCARKWSLHQPQGLAASAPSHRTSPAVAAIPVAAGSSLSVTSSNSLQVVARQSPITAYRGLSETSAGSTNDRRMRSAKRTLPQHQATRQLESSNVNSSSNPPNAGRTRGAAFKAAPRKSGPPRPYPSAAARSSGSSASLKDFSTTSSNAETPDVRFTIALLPYTVHQSPHADAKDPSPVLSWTKQDISIVTQRLQQAHLIIEVEVPAVGPVFEEFDAAITQHCADHDIHLPRKTAPSFILGEELRTPTSLAWHLVAPKKGRTTESLTWVTDPKAHTQFTFTAASLLSHPYGNATPNFLKPQILLFIVPRYGNLQAPIAPLIPLTNRRPTHYNQHLCFARRVMKPVLPALNGVPNICRPQCEVLVVNEADDKVGDLEEAVEDRSHKDVAEGEDDMSDASGDTFMPEFGEMLRDNMTLSGSGASAHTDTSRTVPSASSESRAETPLFFCERTRSCSPSVVIQEPPHNRRRLASPFPVLPGTPENLPGASTSTSATGVSLNTNVDNNGKFVPMPLLRAALALSSVQFTPLNDTPGAQSLGIIPTNSRTHQLWCAKIQRVTATADFSIAAHIKASTVGEGALVLLTYIGWMFGNRPRHAKLPEAIEEQTTSSTAKFLSVQDLSGLFHPTRRYEIGRGIGQGPELEVVTHALHLALAQKFYFTTRCGYHVLRLHGSTQPIPERVGMLKTIGFLILLHFYLLGSAPFSLSPFVLLSIFRSDQWLDIDMQLLEHHLDSSTMATIRVVADWPLDQPISSDPSSEIFQVIVEAGMDPSAISLVRTQEEHDGLVRSIISYLTIGHLPGYWKAHPDYLSLREGFNFLLEDKSLMCKYRLLDSFLGCANDFIDWTYNRTVRTVDDIISRIEFEEAPDTPFHEDNAKMMERLKLHLLHYLRGRGHPNHPDIRSLLGDQVVTESANDPLLRVKAFWKISTSQELLPTSSRRRLQVILQHEWFTIYPIANKENLTVDWGPEKPVHFSSCLWEAEFTNNAHFRFILSWDPQDGEVSLFERWLHPQLLDNSFNLC
ncbi:hypothetical protein BJ138DRAFT_1218568 [Hygrophoropsis aurantiaca]|uniref:Uncharacterized protein n=1 Tax=Hygrophoropsis aurantiaca TaxID=72124 RepID=A0ACB8A192_9AGAM|nr:hypothetical protein BJ138DRAFT_1218568 [Hygrophoropsis aurantiaca]